MVRPTSLEDVLRHAALRQFIKFCLIGLTGTFIDVGISGLLTFGAHWDLYLAKTVSFAIAVTNSYIWNSRWTFRGMGAGKQHELYLKFFAVNVVGYLLNMLVTSVVIFAFTGKLDQLHKPPVIPWAVATAVAVVCASVWNFVANKLWTFRNPAVVA